VVHQADLWGVQKSKYAQLSQLTTSTMAWQTLQPAAPFYLFVPQDVTFQAEYEQNWKITDIMPIHSVGIITARDKLTIAENEKILYERLKKFVALPSEDARRQYDLGEDTRDWKVALAQADVKKSKTNKANILPILYRPFDIRYTYYTGHSRGFICMPRPEVMQHMVNKENLFLLTSRQQALKGFQHIFCAQTIVEGCVVSLKTREITYAFPLYLYNISEDVKKTLFAQVKNGHTPNLSAEFITQFSQKLNLKFITEGVGDLQTTFGPEAIFYYAYAVFHSPTYRGRYAEFLKTDFPRLPLTNNAQLFRDLVDLGHKLADLHLLRSTKLEQFETTFPIAGNNQIEKISYEPETATHGRVYINQTQYFGQIPLASWEFMVGGYQVCLKWLKDRKEQVLGWEEINHYQKIIVALTETQRLMAKIDEVIPSWPLK
jgi:predicted helicase